MGWQIIAHRPNLAYRLILDKLRMFPIFLNCCRKIKIRKLWCKVIWNSNFSVILKILSKHSHAHLFIFRLWLLLCYNGTTLGISNPKCFPIWIFTENGLLTPDLGHFLVRTENGFNFKFNGNFLETFKQGNNNLICSCAEQTAVG